MLWNDFLKEETQKEYYINTVVPALRREYSTYECYPKREEVFNAFYTTVSSDNVKVVILGQDPYHEPGQAMGLSFSVPKEIKAPPSLSNIFEEIQNEYKEPYTKGNDLTFWANQGVLLLNTTLTVRRGQANSHSDIGWQTFTDNVIKYLNTLDQPIVYMLWGKYAQRKAYLITNEKALVLKTSHPSPFSVHRGFFGCKHFLKCNEYLNANGIEPINWLGV